MYLGTTWESDVYHLLAMYRGYFVVAIYSTSKTPLILINWDSEPSGYEENQDNWIFWKIG